MKDKIISIILIITLPIWIIPVCVWISKLDLEDEIAFEQEPKDANTD